MTLPRLYPILDTATLKRRGVDLSDAANAFLEAGARMIQFRHKEPWTREIVAIAQNIAHKCRDSGATWIVNDRADVAVLLDAGLHLGQDDLPPAAARQMVPDSPIGFSTHNDQQLRAAAGEPVDYIALGPIFGTASKPTPDPVVGVDNLRRWRGLTPLPLVAIGGITRSNAAAVFEAGADSVAVISDLVPEDGNAADIRKRTEEWLQLLAK